jgi:hypothetical protein
MSDHWTNPILKLLSVKASMQLRQEKRRCSPFDMTEYIVIQKVNEPLGLLRTQLKESHQLLELVRLITHRPAGGGVSSTRAAFCWVLDPFAKSPC